MTYEIILILVMAVFTAFLRFCPFMVFNSKRGTPDIILYLGRVLPYAIMGMLVVYCLKDVKVFEGSHGLPELIAIAGVAALHVWKKNTLLSIVVGTVGYMLLVQFVFV